VPDTTDQRPPVAVGHVHLNVSDVGAAARWLETVGLRPIVTMDGLAVLEIAPARPGSRSASVNRAVKGYSIAPSGLDLVLLVPLGVVEIGDTLTEGAAAGRNTHIGTGQTRLRPIALAGALGATRRKQCGKGGCQNEA